MEQELKPCPYCRGYDLERRWCHVCNGRGVVDVRLNSERAGCKGAARSRNQGEAMSGNEEIEKQITEKRAELAALEAKIEESKTDRAAIYAVGAIGLIAVLATALAENQNPKGGGNNYDRLRRAAEAG